VQADGVSMDSVPPYRSGAAAYRELVTFA
jgi:hypothetical protein